MDGNIWPLGLKMQMGKRFRGTSLPVHPSTMGRADERSPPIPAHHLRIVILANHLNGKDTHVRGVRVFGADTTVVAAQDDGKDSIMADEDEEGRDKNPEDEGKKLLMLGHDGLSGYTSIAFKMHEGIR
jgi:anaphase-promoting complex subunit 10